MDNDLPLGFFELRRTLDAAALFHRVGSLRDETVLIEVRLPTSFWEIEFHSDGTAEYEVFKSTGAVLDGRGCKRRPGGAEQAQGLASLGFASKRSPDGAQRNPG